MIKPTDKDIGRRVKLSRWPIMVGKLMENREDGGCLVLYIGEKYPVVSNPDYLEWADEDLL